MTEVREQVREDMAHLVNKYLGDHIRKATQWGGMKPPDGSGFITAVLSILPEFQQRQCLACKQFKPLAEFTNNKRNRDGLQIYCRVCRSERVKQYRRENRESIGRYRLAYYNTPKGKYKILAQRARRDEMEVSFDCEQFIDWYAKQELKCHYCGMELQERGKSLDSLTFDRADNDKPYTLENIRIACRRCNTLKGSWFTEKQMLQVAGLYFSGSSNELLIKAPNQSLPEYIGCDSKFDYFTKALAQEVQQDMLKQGWRKVLDK